MRVISAVFSAVLLLIASLGSAIAAERWETLPPTPPPAAGEKTGFAEVNGIKLYYATIGKGPPVVLLHGGLGNSDYWGLQVKALAPHHQVIVVDSRGRSGKSIHGESRKPPKQGSLGS